MMNVFILACLHGLKWLSPLCLPQYSLNCVFAILSLLCDFMSHKIIFIESILLLVIDESARSFILNMRKTSSSLCSHNASVCIIFPLARDDRLLESLPEKLFLIGSASDWPFNVGFRSHQIF